MDTHKQANVTESLPNMVFSSPHKAVPDSEFVRYAYVFLTFFAQILDKFS